MVGEVLVVQPDASQADVLRDIFHRRIGAQLVLVSTTAKAVDAIAARMPDLLLLSSLLSPRDEKVLIEHLRTLENASHLQPITIPQFLTGSDESVTKRGLFGFRKKQKVQGGIGCDPAVFAEEVIAHLRRAHEIRHQPKVSKSTKTVNETPAPSAVDIDQPTQLISLTGESVQGEYVESTQSEYGEPGQSGYGEPAQGEYVESAQSEYGEPGQAGYDEPARAQYVELVQGDHPVAVDDPSTAGLPQADSMEDEIDRLARQLGLDVNRLEILDASTPTLPSSTAEDRFGFGAAFDTADPEAEARRADEVARMQAEAETAREAAVAEARAAAEREAREASAAEIARVQAEAEAQREAAIAEARAEAEREVREALALDLIRVQAEAERMREKAIADAQAASERRARENLAAEVARVRSETESTFTDALNKVKVEAEEAERLRAEAQQLKEEAQQAFTQELARVRDEVEQSLVAQLEASRAEADRIRAAEAQAVFERATVENQLKAELDRLKVNTAQARKADEFEVKRAAKQIKQLEAELANVRAQAEKQKAAELEELRAQMAEMREAAAQHARAAAAEAIAAEVARANAQVSSAPGAVSRSMVRPIPAVARVPPPPETRQLEEPPRQTFEAINDYLSLWQPQEASDEPDGVAEPEEPDGESVFSVENLRRHAKWALPVAACLLLVTTTGTIGTVARFVTPAEKPPALIVEPVKIDEPFIETVTKRVGRLKIESTPSGAEAIIDGKNYGPTPLTTPDLEAGSHTLVLKSSVGTVVRKVTINPNQTTQLTEAIYSGWLAIFSPIPVSVTIDGRPVNLTEDGRVMAAPGKHKVELFSERFNFRTAETLEVRPGETTAHTLSVPMGSVRVTAPAGAEIRVDGQPHQGDPSEGLTMPIGSHEISATHPQLGERRVTVDVRDGRLTEVTLPFD